MIDRYTLPEMAELWSPERRLATWKRVEELALEAWALQGVAPSEAVTAIREARVPTPEQVAEREAVIHHDLAAFVDVLAAGMESGGEWAHYGLTSSDVIDTASGVIMGEAAQVLVAGVENLFSVIRREALVHRDTLILGRTHGMWAEPTSWGLKLANWAFQLARDHERLSAARRAVAVGKVSGAVGTYSQCPPAIEEYVCGGLGIGSEPASTQVTARDRHAQLLGAIALAGASLERFATEIRLLQRNEVAEVAEGFRPGQKGSSAMPHKRNPISSEQMAGMARLLRGYSMTALENVALWHERDISHSSVERIILPDACTILHYMLATFTGVMQRLEVNTDRMRANLDATGGLVISGALLSELISVQGLSRNRAYRIVQRAAREVMDRGGTLGERLASDPEVTVPAARLAELSDPTRFLAGTGVVFERLRGLEFCRS
ncbi:MAG: adenylosuccinate lyase [bacterium]|nr:adenylosuccinate lyase [Acidimicrobiia bacterium]MCY4649013.1 adenylosuccinate lyase [bacterium]